MQEMAGLDAGAPLFAQVAERLAGEIADGGLAEGARVPSTNELAAFYRINPATAAKGINVLADEGLLDKRRGIGMFVAAGARATLLARRRAEFTERYVEPLLTEATRLGIDSDELIGLIKEASNDREGVAAMTPAISVTGLTRRYPGQVALDDVHLTIGTETITGLLGRNGAGKTTLLRILAGQEFPSSGSVRVLGSPPAENENVLRRLVLVREDQAYPDFGYPDFKVSHALRAASICYPNWDEGLASSLLEDFGLRANKAIKSLSRGQRSALGITLGLAARAEVTLFDEPYTGLDAVARQIFYDRLLAEYADFPRTVVLSTHLIDEAAALFENVVMIDRGRVVLDTAADGLRGTVTTVSGPVLAVDSFTQGRPVWERRGLGSQASVVMVGQLSGEDRDRARSLGLDLTPLSLQQLVVRASAGPDGAGSLTGRTSA